MSLSLREQGINMELKKLHQILMNDIENYKRQLIKNKFIKTCVNMDLRNIYDEIMNKEVKSEKK